MRASSLFFPLLALVTAPAFAQDSFPLGPDAQLTPGSLCNQGYQYRYSEHIRYCPRSVTGSTKKRVIDDYDRTLGYQVGSQPRREFKIDHYFPLCMGGSNEPDNLWPQHESVYVHTDPIEGMACDKMNAGRLKQSDAIELIKRAKSSVENAIEVEAYVRNL